MSQSWQPVRRDSPHSSSSGSYGPPNRSYGYPGPEYGAPPPPQEPRGWGYATGGPWPGAEDPYPGPHPYAQYPAQHPYGDPYAYAAPSPYGEEQRESYEFAGWWRRFWAFVIDCILTCMVMCLMVVAAVVIGGVLGVGGTDGGASTLADLVALGIWVIGFIFIIWYFPGAWARSGQTLAQQWLGIMVIRPDGRPIGFGRALLRYYIGGFLDNIVFGLPLGYLWAAWDARKQSWHDKIADTIVVRV